MLDILLRHECLRSWHIFNKQLFSLHKKLASFADVIFVVWATLAQTNIQFLL